MPLYVTRPKSFEYDTLEFTSETTSADIATWVESMRNVVCDVWEKPDSYLVITNQDTTLLSQTELSNSAGTVLAIDGEGRVHDGIPSSLVPYEEVYVSPPVL